MENKQFKFSIVFTENERRKNKQSLKKKSGVYAIVSNINGKLYIGSTSNFYSRFNQHLNLLKNRKHHSIYLQNSINKYGNAEFKFSIIQLCETNKLLCVQQKYLDKYESYIQDNGYNICRVAGSGNTQQFKKPVQQYDLYGNFIKRFNYIQQASNETGVQVTSISDAASGKYNQAGGFLWKLESSIKPVYYKPAINKSKIKQIDSSGKIIKIFNSSSQAAKQMGVSKTAISNCVRGVTETSGGFKWEYVQKTNMKNKRVYLSKKVQKWSLDRTILIKVYDSQKQALLSENLKGTLNQSLLGKNYQCYGFCWKYQGDKFIQKIYRPSCKNVFKYSINGQYIEKYDSIILAAKHNNLNRCNLGKAIKRNKIYGNFFWSSGNEKK